MSKQKSAIAGAVGLVLTVILTAIGLNVGILGATGGEDDAAPTSTVPDTTWATSSTTAPTTTSTVPSDPRIVTVYVDEVVPSEAGSVPSAAATPAPAAPSAAPAPAPASRSASTPTPAAPAPAPPPKPAAAPAPTTAAPKAPAAPAPAAGPSQAAAPAASYPKYDVPGIGTVTLQHADGKIHFWAASTSRGWQYRVENDGNREVEVEFRADGGGEEDEREAKFKAQLENGQIRVRTEMDD